MAEQRTLLKPADIAAQLGVTTGRIYQLIRAGVIPALRIGGAVRIPRAAWEDWLEEQRREATAAAGLARWEDMERRDEPR